MGLFDKKSIDKATDRFKYGFEKGTESAKDILKFKKDPIEATEKLYADLKNYDKKNK